MSNQHRTVLEELDRIPPFLAIALARRSVPVRGYGRLLSYEEIARGAGISRKKIMRWSTTYTWSDIKLGDAIRVLRACGLERSEDRWRLHGYIRRTVKGPRPFQHLRRSRKLKWWVFLSRLQRFTERLGNPPAHSP